MDAKDVEDLLRDFQLFFFFFLPGQTQGPRERQEPSLGKIRYWPVIGGTPQERPWPGAAQIPGTESLERHW